jgi:peroxiredoxin
LSVDSVETSKQLEQKLELGFPILSDPTRELIQGFGLDDPANEIAWPAVYVIDASGKITWRAFFESYKERPPPKEILAAVDAARGE